jgi:hypothetical protein
VITATGAQPHLDHPDVDRRVGEGRERHRGQQLEERESIRVSAVDDLDERRDVVVDLGKALRRDRRPVERDPLGHALQVRGRVTPGAEPELAQQRVDHPRRRGLAVGAGEVDRRIGALRLPEQVHQVGDAVEVGHHPCRQARLELLLDPGERLVTHSGPPR